MLAWKCSFVHACCDTVVAEELTDLRQLCSRLRSGPHPPRCASWGGFECVSSVFRPRHAVGGIKQPDRTGRRTSAPAHTASTAQQTYSWIMAIACVLSAEPAAKSMDAHEEDGIPKPQPSAAGMRRSSGGDASTTAVADDQMTNRHLLLLETPQYSRPRPEDGALRFKQLRRIYHLLLTGPHHHGVGASP